MRQELIRELHSELEVHQIDFGRLKAQQDFILSTASISCFAGGWGSGKTTALVVRALLLSALMPKNLGFIGRMEGKDLRLSTIKVLDEIIPFDWIKRRNDQLGRIELKNGSEILYGDMKSVPNNISLGWLAIDQAEEIPQEAFDTLLGRLRRPVPRRYAFIACNPEGPNWIWKRFHPASVDRDRQSILIEASTWDALKAGFVDQAYVDQLVKTLPPAMIRRYLDGDWGVYEGRVYPDFDPNIHVIDPFPIPTHWPRWESCDPGLSSPTSVHWYALGPHGDIFVYQEHYEAMRPVSYHAACIKTKRGDQLIECTYMDPHAFDLTQSRDSRLISLADQYIEHGIFPVPAQNDWSAGYAKVSELLKVDPEHPHPITGVKGAPRLYVFRNCPKMIEEFLGYLWKRRRPQDLDRWRDEPRDTADHAMDDLRYFVLSTDLLFPEPSKPRRALPWWAEREESEISPMAM